MNDQVIHYALLRDRRHWDDGVTWAGLQQQEDGPLTLARVPGTVGGKPVVVTGSLAFMASGLAVGDRQDLYIADTANHCIVRLDRMCDARMMLPGAGGGGSAPGQFQTPRGLLVTHDTLYVADSDNGRVQLFHVPSLELRAVWEGVLVEPVALAADSQGRIYVLDQSLQTVLRFNKWGMPEDAYNQTMAQALNGYTPISLAIDSQDTLYMADEPSNEILRFDTASKKLDPIPIVKPQRPRAMAIRGNCLYIADEASGEIWVFDCAAGVFLSTLTDYRGPVSAMAVDEAGALYIKPGLDGTYFLLNADLGYVSSGSLIAGPFDAGADTVWERVHAELDLPDGTQAELQVSTADAPDGGPQQIDWDNSKSSPASDVLVTSWTVPRRYLWLRLTLHSDDRRRTTPSLKQVQAETTAESYMNYLPAVYRREDAPERFLEQWLALFRSELSDLELKLEDMPRRFDLATAPESDLPWLASWMAFEPPADLRGDELRSLLPRVHNLCVRRGTPFGLREFVELYTGVRPALFEAFRERHVWQLGYTSTLGFDTALAAGLPDGMIVPGHTFADPKYMGLRGDYYEGMNLDNFIFSRTNPTIAFDWVANSPGSLDGRTVPNDYFSVRWTGQILPRFSERYTFHVLSDDGVRLWIDGVLWIDRWIDQPPTEHSATVELEAGRWYTIQLEYYEKKGGAVIKLYWSSRSQPKEIIPQSQLYSVRDETAQIELSPQASRSEMLLVGQTVVGQSGPLEKSDFGLPLFSETAHLFTVLVPAGALPQPGQRQMLTRILEAEKPAHTDYHLCFVEAWMRVGFQARLGIDSIVAGPPEPMDLGGSVLGVESYLGQGEMKPERGRVGQRARLGQDTRII